MNGEKMTKTFETVLKHVRSLTPAEKEKLIKILAESENMSEKKKMQNEKEIVAELKRIIDEQEKNPDQYLSKSADIAEDIRQKNDRGFSL